MSMPMKVKLLMAMGTRNTIARSAHQAMRRARLIASSGDSGGSAAREGFSAAAADSPAAVCDGLAGGRSAGAAAAGGRGERLRAASSRAAFLRAACRRAARAFLSLLAKRVLPYLAPRPVSTTRRVSATIWASMAGV